MFIRLARIGLLSALIGALSAPAASAENGLALTSDVPPVVDAVAEQPAEVATVTGDVAPATEAVDAIVPGASDAAAAPPLPPAVPPLSFAPLKPGASEQVDNAPAAERAARVAEPAAAPTTTRSDPPSTTSVRLERAAVAARPASTGVGPTAASPLRRPPARAPVAPTPPDRSGSASAAQASPNPATAAADASGSAPSRCLSCLLSRIQAGPAAAAGVGFGLLFGVLTVALLLSPVFLTFRRVLVTARLLPVLIPRLERPG